MASPRTSLRPLLVVGLAAAAVFTVLPATSQAERLSSIARWMVGYWTSVSVTGGSSA